MGEQVAAGFYGGVAQLGEHLPCKQGVMSSNLTISTFGTLKTEYRNISYNQENDITLIRKD